MLGDGSFDKTKEENIRKAAQEISRLGKNSIANPIAYADSLRQRFGLNYEGRTKARILAQEIFCDRLRQTVVNGGDSPIVTRMSLVALEGVEVALKLNVMINSGWNRLTGNHQP